MAPIGLNYAVLRAKLKLSLVKNLVMVMRTKGRESVKKAA